MGYYTNYNLGIRPIGEGKSWLRAYDSEENKKFMEIVEDLNKSCDVRFDEYGWQEDSNFDWEKDLTEFSKKYPDFFFELEGRGDEWDDHWKAIFWNGRYRAENYITIDPDLKLEMLQDGYQDPPKDFYLLPVNIHDVMEAVNRSGLDIPEGFKLSDNDVEKIAKLAWEYCGDDGFWEIFFNNLTHAANCVLEERIVEFNQNKKEEM